MTLLTDNLILESQIRRGEKTDAFTILSQVLQGSATRTSAKFLTKFSHGVVIIVTLANEANAAGFTPQLLVDDGAGNAIVWWAGTELTAAGTYVYVLFPGAMAGAGSGVTANASIVLPREWYFRLSYTTGTPDTDKFDSLVVGMLL